MPPLVAPLFLSLALLLALGARAEGAELRLFVALDYRADAGLDTCPSEAEFRATIEKQLGYQPFREDSQLRVVARTKATPQGIRGVVRWEDATGAPIGERELGSEHGDCAGIARAMGFAIVVQIQLLAQDAGPPGTPPEVPTTDDAKRVSATSDEPTAETEPPDESPREEERWRFLIGAGPALALGLAPEVTVEGRLFAAARRRAWSVELGAEASLPTQHARAGGRGFEQQVALGSLAGCGHWRAFSGCAVNKVGVLEVRGFGVDMPRSPSGATVQAGLRLALGEPPLDGWLARFYVEGLATFVSWRVTLNQREVWETPPFSLLAGADLAAVFQ